MLTAIKQPKGFYKTTLLLMLPIVLQNMITQTVALADTFMVGVLGEEFLAAVTLANTPFFIVMLITFGVQGGVSVMVSQYWGKGDTRAINRIMGMGLYVSVTFCLITSVAMFLFSEQVLGALTDNLELIPLGCGYARIVGFSYVFSAISGVYIGTQRSMENTKLGVIVLSTSALTNVFLNWVLIFGKLGMPAMGVEGAALATLIARVAEVVIIAVYALRSKRLPLEPRLILRPGGIITRDFFKYASPVVLNEALWSLGTSTFPVIMGHMEGSTQILAAFTIAGNLERIFTTAVFAVGSAASVIIGREIGAGRRESVYKVGVSLAFLGFVMGLVAAALFFLLRIFLLAPVIFPLFKLSAEAGGIATTMVTILCMVVPIRTLAFTLLIGILRGGGDAKAVMLLDLGGLYLISIPAAAITGLVLKSGITVVYLCICAEEIFKVTAGILRFRSKRWINDVTREQIE